MTFNIKLSSGPVDCPAFPAEPDEAQFVAVAKYTLAADGDMEEFENYIWDTFDNIDFKDTMDYWIKRLDDTNTPFPTMAPTSPTSAPSGVVQYMTT
eukprot:CAMPEP_0201585526 /NCGR_PEP_ID=MMETSP0190_2-20130828/122965_1 /ASSEMBLY_ACC=CAM_ASM_000263 /TAXON_ID=37353 /ORGANISM="Rosalina sp." /LENGTH=95 /DNA_ID=CAMNT_0048031635 /DNA_START=309 /DNA_END=592 /DNA_ORIENTATION=+